MSGKFMKVKRILIPTLTLVLIASQLAGCGAASQDELINMMKNQEAIMIEVPEPKDEVSCSDISYEWTEVASLTDHDLFRYAFDDSFKIVPFGEGGKSGVAYVDPDGNHTNNTTLMYAFNNQKFIDLYNNTETWDKIIPVISYEFINFDESTTPEQYKLASLNTYFNIFPTVNPTSFKGSDALTRMEFLGGVYRACQPVQDLEPYEDLAAYVDPDYTNPDTIFALQMADHSYLKIEDGDLNEKTYNTGSITRAEAIYTLVQLFYADEYNNLDVKKASAYSDTKNGGDLAREYGYIYKEKGSKEESVAPFYRSYTLNKAIEENKLPEDLYKAMVVAKNHNLISTSDSRWSDGITKYEAIDIIVRVFLDQGAELNVDRGEADGLVSLEQSEEWKKLASDYAIFKLNGDHLKRTGDEPMAYDYTYTEEFVGKLYMICDGWFNGASKEEIDDILSIALYSSPSDASGEEVYQALVTIASTMNHDLLITGKGTPPTQSAQSNQNTSGNSNNSGGSNSGGSGNTSSNNGGGGSNNSGNSNNGGGGSSNKGDTSSRPPVDNSGSTSGMTDEEIHQAEKEFAEKFGGSSPEYDPDNSKDSGLVIQ